MIVSAGSASMRLGRSRRPRSSGPPFDDVGEQAGLAEDPRLDRLEQIAVAVRRQRLAVRRAPRPLVVRVADQHGAASAIAPSTSRAISPTNCRFVQMYMNASVHIA